MDGFERYNRHVQLIRPHSYLVQMFFGNSVLLWELFHIYMNGFECKNKHVWLIGQLCYLVQSIFGDSIL